MSWLKNLFARSESRQVRRARPRPSGFRPAFDALETRLTPSANVLTFHNDFASTGQNLNETALSPANVHVGAFGKIATSLVDGQVYAQPLVDSAVQITAGAHPGTRDVVFVPTQNDSLYAIDADDPGLTGVVLWKRSFTDLAIPGNNTLGATAIAPVPADDTNSGDINPVIGITGTPVIDAATNTLYLVAKTKETIGGAAHYVQRLHAINIADGSDRTAPFLIGDTTGSYVNNTPIYSYGTGDGSVIDPYNGTGRSVVPFNALREHQRAALTLVNGTVYVDWASHSDNGPYHGWVAAWDVSDLAGQGMKLSGVLNVSPNDGESGIWQGSGALAFEADGSAFYFMTGNGTGGPPKVGADGFPTDANYNEAVVKVVADTATSGVHQNANGWGMKVVDYFIPTNVAQLDNTDNDFGSGAPLLLPDSAGIAGHPHLMVVGGKEGKLYVLDRDNLGKFDPNVNHVVSSNATVKGLLSTPAWYNGSVYVVSGYAGNAYQFVVAADGSLNATSQTAVDNFGNLTGSPSISANGTTGGIVWIPDRNANVIRAYGANSLSTEIWNTSQKPGGADNVGTLTKFGAPTVADGQMFVATLNSLVIYGLTPPANAVPITPSNFQATALSSSAVQLSWQDTTTAPNTANGYAIEQSSDGVHFTQVTTAPGNTTALSIGGLQALTTYYFRVHSFNGLGNSVTSSIATVTTTYQAASIDFSKGFAGASGTVIFNGTARITDSKAELTDGGNNEAGSFFSSGAVDVSRFSTQFAFQINSAAADGFAFVVQGNGPTIVGNGGSGLGYAGIGRSVAVKFDIFSNAGEGNSSTGLYTNGAEPTNPSTDLGGLGIDLHSGHVFQVSMSYDGVTLSVTITDTVTGAIASQIYAVDIPGIVASNNAFVGFTGGTGGTSAYQDILAWSLSPNAQQSPATPSDLGATAASATSIHLTWTNNALNQAGYHLDRATDPDFTQSFITEILPANPSNFTDTAVGLAPGGTYYYRLRAFNTAGDSGTSNVIAVSIPIAPPKPSNAQVDEVTATEIDLSWTDNAGQSAQGYKVLRAVNHGSFTVYAVLPYMNAPAPSTYEWSDTAISPGTFYEYHILAYNVSGNNDFTGANVTTVTLAPTGLSAAASTGFNTISWTAPAGAVSYNVYRATSPGGEGTTPIATGITATSFVDSAVTSGVTYYYKVSAVDAGGESPLSGERVASVDLALNKPAFASSIENGGTPERFAVDGDSTTRWSSLFKDPQSIYVDLGATYTINEVKLNWEAAAGMDYTIQVSDDTKEWKTIWTVEGNLTSGVHDYPDLAGSSRYVGMFGTARATGYGYSLFDFNVYGSAAPATPAAPTGLAAAVKSPYEIDLSWTAPAGDVLGYNIFRGTSPGGESATPLNNSPITSTTWQDTTVTPGHSSFYTVRAVNLAGAGEPSLEATATTPTIASADLALGRPVFVSSAESNAFAGPNAVDGNSGSRWSSKFIDSQWIYVDLGATYDITEVKLNWEAASGKDYLIQVSSDATNWTTLWTVTGNTTAGVHDYTGLSGSGQYVRIYGTARNTQYGYSLFDFNVYGTGATAGITPLSRSGWALSASSTEGGGSVNKAIDGQLGSRWSSGTPQRPGQWFQIDLGSIQSFAGITFDAGTSLNDYARGYQVLVSDNGADWSSPIAEGVGTGPRISIQLGSPMANRYIRIVQTGSSPSWWSIGELNVYV